MIRKNRSGKKKILLIDDEMDLVNLVKMRLELHDYAVVPLYTSKRAVEITKREQPNLILLDVMMPDIDGYEVCRTLKSDEKTKHIPVILFTSKIAEVQKMSKEHKDIGADDYIPKPFNPDMLLDKVNKFLK